MARGNNQKQSSVRSELSDDDDSKRSVASFLIDATNAQSRGFTIGGESFDTKAPSTNAEEKGLYIKLMRAKGLEMLASGLEKTNKLTRSVLGYPEGDVVKTPFGLANANAQPLNLSTYSNGYNKSDFSKKAEGLADLLNDMVAKGQGGSKLFKEVDSVYQDMKSARDSIYGVGKTTQISGGRVHDASGDNFNLSNMVGQGNEKLFFNPMKKAELTAGEMYTVVRELPTIASRLRDKAYVAGTGQEVVERYLPAKFRNVDSIDSPAWFKVTLQRNPDGYSPVKVKYVTTDKEKQTAKDQYRG
jgi:hypothetical protein